MFGIGFALLKLESNKKDNIIVFELRITIINIKRR